MYRSLKVVSLLLIASVFFAGGCRQEVKMADRMDAPVGLDTGAAREKQSPGISDNTDSKNGPKEKAMPEKVSNRYGNFTLKEYQFNSPFTKETVLKLNAIVRRSKDAIDDFDLLRKEYDDKGGLSGEKALASLQEFSGRAVAARDDMEKAVSELKESGEDYSREALAGMVKFVQQVDDEIQREIRRIEKTSFESQPIPD
jgi:hypothetical protein